MISNSGDGPCTFRHQDGAKLQISLTITQRRESAVIDSLQRLRTDRTFHDHTSFCVYGCSFVMVDMRPRFTVGSKGGNT
jgi:hypothetical protein